MVARSVPLSLSASSFQLPQEAEASLEITFDVDCPKCTRPYSHVLVMHPGRCWV